MGIQREMKKIVNIIITMPSLRNSRKKLVTKLVQV